MNFSLKRTQRQLYGIFGQFTSEDGSFFCVSLERAYQQEDGSFLPKLADGTYTFKRRFSPDHQRVLFTLDSAPWFMGAPVTFIEIHKGNWNRDSKGCILLGLRLGTMMIEDSEKAFDAFMDLQADVDEFQLQIETVA